jgi:predicted TIM-barrel fold metal-dependent hydrolase
VNAFKRLAAGYSADEKAKLFSGRAKRVYRGTGSGRYGANLE